MKLLQHAGTVGRVVILLWLGVLLYGLYCQWRLREYRRPDAPAWKFWAHPHSAEPDLYTAAGQLWVQRAGAAMAATIIGFWIMVAPLRGYSAIHSGAPQRANDRCN